MGLPRLQKTQEAAQPQRCSVTGQTTGGQITVTFDAQEQKPAQPAMAFAPVHDGLQARTWNHATWGKENPPPMKKGGGKVKEHYWLSENP